METDEQQISRLYHDRVNIDEAIKLMRRSHNISSDLIKFMYDELSEQAEKLITDRFHYYTIEVDETLQSYSINCWTSRYLLRYKNASSDFALHKITIFDAFNDKSM
jgi:hypothetical protein